jgi:hypothetical protein
LRTSHKIGWRPADFWPSTLVEFFDCIDAHNEEQGEETEPAGMSQDAVAAAFAKFGG